MYIQKRENKKIFSSFIIDEHVLFAYYSVFNRAHSHNVFHYLIAIDIVKKAIPKNNNIFVNLNSSYFKYIDVVTST